MSLRRFRLLVEHLPPGNALDRARFGRWGDDETLMYAVESRLRELIALTYNANRRHGSAPQEPEYLPRPLTPEEERRKADQDAYDAAMVRQLQELE